MAISGETHEVGTKAAWIHPVIQELEIWETNTHPNRGIDGSKHADCTKS